MRCSSVAYTSSEVEPWLAIDSVSGNLVAIWQQDRWSDWSARALRTAVSSDGGVSWGSFFLPWSLCAGGTPPAGDFPRVTDPLGELRSGRDRLATRTRIQLELPLPSGDSDHRLALT